MDYELSEHAQDALVKRKIPVEWVERVLTFPQLTQPDREDVTLIHRLAQIPENCGRILRVVVNL